MSPYTTMNRAGTVYESSPWSASTLKKLHELWGSGVPTQTIAVALGRSKGSVIGKAHRLGLSRPSPIRRDPDAPKKTKKASQATANLASAIARSRPNHVSDFDNHTYRPPPPQQPTQAPLPTVRDCQWIEGEGPPWVMCGARSAPGRPYCRDHAARAYLRVGQKREDAA